MADTKISDMTAAGAAQRNHGTVFPTVNNGTNYKETFDGFASYLNTGFFTTNYPTSPTVGSFGETYAKLKVLSGNVLLTGKGILRGDDTTGIFKKLFLGNFPTNRATGIYSQILGGQYNTGFLGDNQFILGGDHNKIVGDSSYILGGSYNNVSGGFTISVDGDLYSLNNYILGGTSNSASGAYSYVGGGKNNLTSAALAAVMNGVYNRNYCDYGFIGGGYSNRLGQGLASVIVGGDSNICSGTWNGIVCGQGNAFLGNFPTDSAFIGGGTQNQILSYTVASSDSAILAGNTNTMYESATTIILGGRQNTVYSSNYSLIGGGYANAIYNGSSYSVIVAGTLNEIVQNPSSLGNDFIGAGGSNYISGHYDAIVAGYRNIISGSYTVIVGGYENLAKGFYQFIGGGYQNITTGEYSSIGGGSNNRAGWSSEDFYATVAGGGSNTTYGLASAILGGQNNYNTGNYTVTVGGRSNSAVGDYSFAGGGLANSGLASGSVVVGGRLNIAHKTMSSVLGGESNISSGDYASVVGGFLNIAQSGHSSVLAGTRNIVRATGAVILGGNRGAINTSALSFIGNGNLNTINGTGVSVILQGNSNSIFSGGYNTVLNGNNVKLHAGNFNLACGKDITVNADSNFIFGRNSTSNYNGVTILGDSTTSTKNSFKAESAYLYFTGGVNIKGPLTFTSGVTPLTQFSPSGQVGQLNWDNSNLYLYRGPTLGWGTIQAPNFGENLTSKVAIHYDWFPSNYIIGDAWAIHFIRTGFWEPTLYKYPLDLASANMNFNPTSVRINTYMANAGANDNFNLKLVYSDDINLAIENWSTFGPSIDLGMNATPDEMKTATGVVSVAGNPSVIYIQPVVESSAVNPDPLETLSIRGFSFTIFGESS